MKRKRSHQNVYAINKRRRIYTPFEFTETKWVLLHHFIPNDASLLQLHRCIFHEVGVCYFIASYLYPKDSYCKLMMHPCDHDIVFSILNHIGCVRNSSKHILCASMSNNQRILPMLMNKWYPDELTINKSSKEVLHIICCSMNTQIIGTYFKKYPELAMSLRDDMVLYREYMIPKVLSYALNSLHGMLFMIRYYGKEFINLYLHELVDVTRNLYEHEAVHKYLSTYFWFND
jgi:hypothetical protein